MSQARAPRARDAELSELDALPDNVVGEIIDGELLMSPRPAPKHAEACVGLTSLLAHPFRSGIGGPGGWWILVEPELHLGVDPRTKAVVPDLAGWRRTRMPALPETAYFALAPDWVCEILSPSTALLDRARKLPFYARAGVPHVWLVDPLIESVEVYRLHEQHYLLLGTYGADEKVRIEPFDAVELDLALLWPRIEAPAAP